MPERLDRVTIATSRGDIAIPWASRDALLQEIAHLDSKTIKAAFDADGASRPVELSREDKTSLLNCLNHWYARVGYSRLPAGLWDLRNGLANDLHETARGRD